MTGTEIVLAVAFAIQSAALSFYVHAASAEKKRLLNAVMSKDAAEAQRFAMMERVAAKPRKVKAAKSEPLHPYGL